MTDTQDDFTSDLGATPDTGYDADIANGQVTHSIPEHPHRPSGTARPRAIAPTSQVIATYPLFHAAQPPKGR